MQALIMVQSEADAFGTEWKAFGCPMSRCIERQVGVGLLGVSLEVLEQVGNVDGDRNLAAPSFFQPPPPSPFPLFSSTLPRFLPT